MYNVFVGLSFLLCVSVCMSRVSLSVCVCVYVSVSMCALCVCVVMKTIVLIAVIQNGFNSLIGATRHGHTDIVATLLNNGANPNLQEKVWHCCLHVWIMYYLFAFTD